MLTLLLAACADEGRVVYSGEWISPVYRDHPLAGRLWIPATGRFATDSEISDAISDADFVLVGEKHDNADHHRFQSDIIRMMFTQRRRPAIVFEMLTPDQQPKLDRHLADRPRDSAGVGEAVGWEAQGWPRWEIYRPITDVALEQGAPLRAGGLDRATTRAVSAQGVDALGDERAAGLRLDEPISETMRAEMSSAIHTSHCEMLPQKMLDPMVNVTLAKDAAMAEAMLGGRAQSGRDSALLIAGTGHVRKDWGVPWHLSRLMPDARVVSIGLVEVVAEEFDPAAYVVARSGTELFDLVWFTPRVDDIDPCQAFAEQLQQMRSGHDGKSQGAED
ncbi:MAG: ChaN family lipoprotein [Rhodospirillales bacterium]|nr:MAG: ChaN family lipoprotein [Rhodospirillales bacterium]